jgi:hypothetical protein
MGTIANITFQGRYKSGYLVVKIVLPQILVSIFYFPAKWKMNACACTFFVCRYLYAVYHS